MGDTIDLSVAERRLHLDVPEGELAARRAALPPPPDGGGGYQGLYMRHVLQADRGADFDFLVGSRGHAVPRESH